MTNNLISYEYQNHLPYDVIDDIPKLPQEAQREFHLLFTQNKKSLLLSYFLHFFGPVSFTYGYLGKWGLQILYWITAGGYGIWWLILVFQMPSLVRHKNYSNARRALRYIKLKYGAGFKNKHPKSRMAKPSIAPRSINVNYDPSKITIENLDEGYMFDYDMKTWKAIEKYQFDAENGVTDRIFKVMSDMDEGYVIMRKESNHLFTTFAKRVNVFQIDPELETKMLTYKQPPNIFYYGGIRFFREEELKGTMFQIHTSIVNKQDAIHSWVFLDEDRKQMIRLDQYGPRNFKTYHGFMVPDYIFTDILPGIDE